jgi:PAS domain S-box-containing protein
MDVERERVHITPGHHPNVRHKGRFRAVFDQSYHFICLLAPDGTVIEANRTALDFGGLRPDQVIGRAYWDLTWWGGGAGESPGVLRAAVARASAGHTTRHELEMNGVDSRSVVDLSIKPVRDRHGHVILLVAEARDISELRQALHTLRLTEHRLEEAQRIAHLGYWDYNVADQQAVYSSNLHELLGLDSPADLQDNEHLLTRIHPDDAQELGRIIERSYYTGRPYEHHFRVIMPDGHVRSLFSAGGPIADADGQTTRISGIIQDVTGRRQLEESLAHMVERLSGLNSLGQAVSSSVDLQTIYDQVLPVGRRLLKAHVVLLFLRQGDELAMVAVDQEETLNLTPQRIPLNAGVAGEAWTMGRSVWVSGDECRRRRSEQLVKALNFDPGSLIAVPVRWENELLGVMQAADLEDDAFTLDDVRVLQAVGNWTAIAIGKARQHQALERRVRESEAIAAVGRALSETLEPQEIIELIVQSAHNIVPRSDWGIIHLLRGRPERLDPVAVAGTTDPLSDYVIAPDEGIAGLVFSEGQLINVPDVSADPRASAYARSVGLHSLLVAPVVARNRRLGTISLHCREPGAFTEADERTLTILAAAAGLAIENAYLFDSQRRARGVAEQQRERLRVLTDRLVAAQEEERLRISRELHDEAGQSLTSLKIGLDLLRRDAPPELGARLADLATLTGETMDALRTLAHDLRPPGLDTFGLNIALESLCHDFAGRAGLAVQYEGEELPELSAGVALSLYRFTQEALTNVVKHAAAGQVHVRLATDNRHLTLSITDDGRGFNYDPEARPSGMASGLGLVSMQERISLLGGSWELDTAPGRGARLTARVPVQPQSIPS